MSQNPTAGQSLDSLLGSKGTQTLAALAVTAVATVSALEMGNNGAFIVMLAVPLMWRMGMAYGRRQ